MEETVVVAEAAVWELAASLAAAETEQIAELEAVAEAVNREAAVTEAVEAVVVWADGKREAEPLI